MKIIWFQRASEHLILSSFILIGASPACKLSHCGEKLLKILNLLVSNLHHVYLLCLINLFP